MKLPPPDTTVDRPFGSTEEDAIISLSLDQPEFFGTIAQTIKPQMFKQETRQYVFAQLANAYEKYSTIPTRSLLCDIVAKDLTAEDPYEEILDLLKRPSNPREVPQVKATVLKWAQTQAYGMLFNEESQIAFHRGDFQFLANLLEEAQKLTDVRGKTFSFWDQWEEVFIDDASDHITTGFLKLNNELNGGPSPGEVLCWMAATNVGKCDSADTKIIVEDLSRIYDLELEDGTIIKIAGFRELETSRGRVKVCDLTAEDDILEVPTTNEASDIDLSDLWLYGREENPT